MQTAAEEGVSTLPSNSVSCLDDDALKGAAAALADLLANRLGGAPEVIVLTRVPANAIWLTLKDASPALEDEGYTLIVRKDSVTIRANSHSGCVKACNRCGNSSRRESNPLHRPTKP